MKTSVADFLIVLLLLTVACTVTNAQETPPNKKTDFATSSRKAFIEMGMSEKYFDEHFRLVESIDKPGDQRVIWRYSLSEYEVIVNDAVGYYTTQDNRRVYIHSVKSLLGSTRDINKTISRTRAAQLMKKCIGEYGGEAIQFLRLVPNKHATFYLTAHGHSKPEKAQLQRQPQTSPTQPPDSSVDQPARRKGPRPKPQPMGYIDLETGKCLKGTAVAAPIMN
jgi:hypothetical protein